MADEAVEACIALWNSWEVGALKVDRESGIFADPSKVHYVRYDGSKVRTNGALTAPPSPQGRPGFMQAGASDRGRNFRSAEGRVGKGCVSTCKSLWWADE